MTPQPVREQSPDEVYVLLLRAAACRRPVSVTYDGLPRLLCPHVLGRKAGRRQAFVYQFEGTSHSGLTTTTGGTGGWRCLAVEKLSQAELQAGAWHTEPRAQRQTCIDEVDFDVDAQPEEDPQ